jgi:transcriptional regulator of acetoin/glycerol metabolism
MGMSSSVFSPVARAVFDAMVDALFVFDPHGKLLYANEVARNIIEELDGAGTADSADALLPQLGRRGARISPLWAGDLRIGQAVFVPKGGAGPTRATLAERERDAIVQTLNATGWRLTESAKRLGISRTTLWRRVNAYGLERPAS